MTMYHQHFELTRSPFSIAPDPHFLYMSERHREALAHLEWGLWAGGFVLLTGEVGTGKTTLCRCLLERIPDDTDVAFVINPRVTAAELLTTICEELGDAPPEAEQDSVKKLVDRINGHLIEAHARNKRVVLVIDEAQNLSFDVLEQVRLLTNLETDARKLLQVILLGQPELLEMLEAPELRQLAQRVTARYHLLPLSRDELSALVHHRLVIAGARRNPFTPDALAVLHRRAAGIPRVANVIADRALLGAYAGNSLEVTAPIVARAASEVLGAQSVVRRMDTRTLLKSAALVALIAALGLGIWLNLGDSAKTPASVAAELAAPTPLQPATSPPSLPPWHSRQRLRPSNPYESRAPKTGSPRRFSPVTTRHRHPSLNPDHHPSPLSGRLQNARQSAPPSRRFSNPGSRRFHSPPRYPCASRWAGQDCSATRPRAPGAPCSSLIALPFSNCGWPPTPNLATSLCCPLQVTAPLFPSADAGRR